MRCDSSHFSWFIIEITEQFLCGVCDLVICAAILWSLNIIQWITRNSIEWIFSSVILVFGRRLARRNSERAQRFPKPIGMNWNWVRVCASVCVYPIVFSIQSISFWHSYHKFFVDTHAHAQKVTVIQFDQHNFTNRFSAFNNSISIIDVSSFFLSSPSLGDKSSRYVTASGWKKMTGSERKKMKKYHQQQQQLWQQQQHHIHTKSRQSEGERKNRKTSWNDNFC